MGKEHLRVVPEAADYTFRLERVSYSSWAGDPPLFPLFFFKKKTGRQTMKQLLKS